MKYILQIPSGLDIGGMEKVAHDIFIFSDPDEYIMDYIVFTSSVGAYEQDILDRGGKVYHIDQPARSYISFVKALNKIMSENRYDAVHAHTMFNIGLIMAIARYNKIPIRVSHAHSSLNNGSAMKKMFYEGVMRLLIKHNATNYVACGKDAGVRLYGADFFERHGQIILNGIDAEKFEYSEGNRLKIRRELGLENNLVIGHTGHLAYVKNQKFLIRLMPEILKRKPESILICLGDGPDRTSLEELIKELGLDGKVLLTGNVNNVNEYLSAMDVFAFPSLFEGMPLSIIEVQANGLPCVISTGVPRDVYLTDLIIPLGLKETEKWIDAICNADRNDSVKYSGLLKTSGFDTMAAMNKIYSIYERTI